MNKIMQWKSLYRRLIHLKDYYKLNPENTLDWLTEEQKDFLNCGQPEQYFHLVCAQQLSRQKIEGYLKTAFLIRKLDRDPSGQGGRYLNNLGIGKRVLCLFAQPSSRTKHSFICAAKLLGISAKSEHDLKLSSMYKGETFSDTIRTFAQYYHAFVIRHKYPDSSEKAIIAMNSLSHNMRPVINAGSGSAQHPTQALLDLMTIKDEQGRLDGLTVMFVGDLLYGRTVNSLAYLLGKYFCNNRLIFISPEDLRIKEGLRKSLKQKNVEMVEDNNWDKYISSSDVIYLTRVQEEWFKENNRLDLYEKIKNNFIFTKKQLNQMELGSSLLHPLPRVNELSVEEAHAPNKVAIWRQVENGMYLRASIFAMTFNYEQSIVEAVKKLNL